MNVQPLSDLVIVRRQEQMTASDGGIYLPPSEDFTEDIGTVVYVGRGKPHKCKKCAGATHIPMQVAVGDKVIFSTNGHQLTRLYGEQLIVLRQDSIIAVIEDDEKVSSTTPREGRTPYFKATQQPQAKTIRKVTNA